MACHPLFWRVSVASHALVEEEKGSVEGGGHCLQDFGWNVIWAWSFAFGHAVETASVSLCIDLAIKHGWGKGWGGG